MLEFTQQEERDLKAALRKAVDGIREARKVLTGIGARLELQFSESNLYIANVAGFVADHKTYPDALLGKNFTDDSLWKK